MKKNEWQLCMVDLISGTEKHLCFTAPKKDHMQLWEFRWQVTKARSAYARNQFEQRLEKFLQSAPHLRAAGKRYLAPRIVGALQAATKAAQKATVILKQSRKVEENQ